MKNFLIIFLVILALIVTVSLRFSPEENKQSDSDKIVVEQYIRDNIKTIAIEKPVLGGSWYITLVEINPLTKTGTMEYEDGHIQGKANFNYVRNGAQVTINLIDNSEKEPVACTMDAKQCSDGSYVGRTGPNCEFVCP